MESPAAAGPTGPATHPTGGDGIVDAPPPPNAAAVATVHAAKGRSWPAVLVARKTDVEYPVRLRWSATGAQHRRLEEEQCRLAYVASHARTVLAVGTSVVELQLGALAAVERVEV